MNLRFVLLIPLCLAVSSCATTYASKSVAEAERLAALCVQRGLKSRDEAARGVATVRASGKPLQGTWDEAKMIRYLDSWERHMGRNATAANIAYNQGRITEAQRLALVAQAEGVEVQRRAAIGAAISSMGQTMNQMTHNANMQSQAIYQNMILSQPRTISLQPSGFGGYTGTIR